MKIFSRDYYLIIMQAFFYVECVCNAWFTFEFLVRFVVSPSKLHFFRGLLNVIDLVATVSFYLDVLLNVLDMDNEVRVT